MAKRTNSVDTTFFSLELLRRIPRSQRITAQELHQQLTDAGIERNVRTIQRQLERLSQHFDLECDDRCRPYGWRWRVGSRGLSMAQLSPAESLLMQMAQAHLKHLLPAHLMASFSPFFSQAGHTLSHSEQAQREREWSQKVRVTVSTVNRALSLRDSRKKKEDTMESPNFASQRSRRICSFSPGVFVGKGLSASRRNISLETVLRKICKLNNVLTSYFLIWLIPTIRFFRRDAVYSN